VTSPAPSQQDQRALARARRALRCLPFRLALYQELERTALSSTQLAARGDWAHLSRRRLQAQRTEDHLIWLIQLGVLRREVDGQGLTERVRLTPLGREVLGGWSKEIPAASPLTRLRHGLQRHWPRL
jgi:hypothetical protein